MNWKQLASMIAAGAAAAAITVASNYLIPHEPMELKATIAAIVAAAVHKINIWGGIPEIKVQS